MILVCGASGQLGGTVARKLAERGLPMRALSRDVRKLDGLKALGADVVQGDLIDRASLERACAGVPHASTVSAIGTSNCPYYTSLDPNANP